MKLSQPRLADWAFTCATVSAVLPWIALLAFFGLGHWDLFSLQCVGLVGLSVLTLWIFHKMQRNEFAFRKSAWMLGITYFAVIITVVARFFESVGLTLLFAAPETAGIVLCFIGLWGARSPSVPAEADRDWSKRA